MSRIIKNGLDYFPIDTNILNDLKIRRMKRKYGAESFLLYVTLLCDIYANSYWLEASDDYLFDLSEQMQISESRVLEMVLSMVKIGMFDSQLFEDKQILTSGPIQKQYFCIKKRFIDNHGLDTFPYLVNVDLMGNNAELKPIKYAESTQRKEKESKVKVKEKENKENLSSSSSSACVTQKSCKEIFAGYREELLGDEDWRASVVMMSGKGDAVVQLLPEVMEMFDMHAISMGRIGEIRNSNQYTEHFINWWRCMKFRSATEIETYNQLRNNEVGGEPAAKGFRRYTQPEKKSKVQQAFELSELVCADVKKIMLG